MVSILKNLLKNTIFTISLFHVVNGLYSEKYKAKTNTKAVYEKIFKLKIINEMPRACS